MEINGILNKGLEVDTILEKEREELYQSELDRARKAAETIKRLRLHEGPEDQHVYVISRKVESARPDLPKNKRTQVDPLKERIRQGIQEENRIIKETYELDSAYEAVYKVKPAIIPLHGSEAVHVEAEAFAKSKRGGASLQDLVDMHKPKAQVAPTKNPTVVELDETLEESQEKAGSLEQPEYPFTRWGAIAASLQTVLNTRKFGDIYSVSTKEETIIRAFLHSRYPVLLERGVQFKIGKVVEPDNEHSLHLSTQAAVRAAQFNVVFYGQTCPLSKCCRLSLCLQICGITGTAKINCMATAGSGGGALLSHYNPQLQFTLDLDLLQALFPHRYESLKSPQLYPATNIDLTQVAAFSSDPPSGALQHQQPLNSNRSDLNKQAQHINHEVNRAIVAGTHKFQSLRAVAASSREQLSRKGKRAPRLKRKVAEDSMDEGIDAIFGDDGQVEIDMDEIINDDGGNSDAM